MKKTLDKEVLIEYSEIAILCSKLKEIEAYIKLFYKTNFESSIDKSYKLMFYQLIEPVTNQIILFYELISNDHIFIVTEEVENVEREEKTETDRLQEKIKEELKQLREAQKTYTIQ